MSHKKGENVEGMEYFYEMFEGLPRAGPGDNASTRRAFGAMKNLPPRPLILDIGCGPGMQSIELAKISGGRVMAIDNHQPFLDALETEAKKQGVDDRIETKNVSMLDLEFKDETFDIVWSEGALYIMGFPRGLRLCRQLVKKSGYVAVTEAVLLSPHPPAPLMEFWEKEYPDIKDVQGNLAMIEQEGFSLQSHFTLPAASWLDHFYTPLQRRLAVLTEKYRDNEEGLNVFRSAQKEIDLFERYSDCYGYHFFIMRKDR
ncbi:MAG TPA: class I SAM-dependent methyltransferase [Thermoplasmatales archaeon]|nr:class I SAM-dependent methyltransferase [Thermoplasmatales archaeon]